MNHDQAIPDVEDVFPPLVVLTALTVEDLGVYKWHKMFILLFSNLVAGSTALYAALLTT
jgi:hypothetical protein